MNKILSSKIFTAYRHWFTSLAHREKNALTILSAFLFILLLWQGIWIPVEKSRRNAEIAYAAAHADLSWMQAHAGEVKQAASTANPASDAPLLATASNAAQIYQLTLSHAEPTDNGTLRVALDNVSFSRLLLWLEAMQREHGITPAQITIDKQTAPGLVSATLTLHTNR